MRTYAGVRRPQPTSQPLKQHLSSPPPATPQPNQLLAHDASRPSQSAAAHARHAGSHPSLAEGYVLHIPLIITHRIAPLLQQNPTPSPALSSYASCASSARSRLVLSPSRSLLADDMGGLQVHLDIGGSSRASEATLVPAPRWRYCRVHHEVPPSSLVYFCGFARYL